MTRFHNKRDFIKIFILIHEKYDMRPFTNERKP